MLRLLSFAALVALCAGCGKSDGVDRASVEGKVTLDGVAIEDGSIAFIPAGGNKGPTAGGVIRDGRYSIAGAHGPVLGRHRVEIHASRKTGKKIQTPMASPGTMMDETVEAVPDRYNAASTLEREITKGRNTLDFELTKESSQR